jgi:hypothetical protein
LSLKLHILQNYFDFYPENTRALSNEHSKTFRQIISQMKDRYNGEWSPNISADCCWGVMRETPLGECKMQKKTKRVFN